MQEGKIEQMFLCTFGFQSCGSAFNESVGFLLVGGTMDLSLWNQKKCSPSNNREILSFNEILRVKIGSKDMQGY